MYLYGACFGKLALPKQTILLATLFFCRFLWPDHALLPSSSLSLSLRCGTRWCAPSRVARFSPPRTAPTLAWRTRCKSRLSPPFSVDFSLAIERPRRRRRRARRRPALPIFSRFGGNHRGRIACCRVETFPARRLYVGMIPRYIRSFSRAAASKQGQRIG